MIRPDFAKWGQTPEDMRQLSLKAQHARSRERFQALYMIGSEQFNATEWAQQIGRKNQTVMGWVHRYNRQGPESLYYQRTGGPAPLLSKRRKTKSLAQSEKVTL
jgi:transposase